MKIALACFNTLLRHVGMIANAKFEVIVLSITTKLENSFYSNFHLHTIDTAYYSINKYFLGWRENNQLCHLTIITHVTHFFFYAELISYGNSVIGNRRNAILFLLFPLSLPRRKFFVCTGCVF